MSDLHVYDTTLRDGAQQEGLNLSVEDKLAIAMHLDELGVGFIEGGWPGANPKDTEFFARAQRDLTLRNATLAAFGATRRPGTMAADDPQVRALLDSGASVVTVVAKAHVRHVESALRTTLPENLAMIRDTVSFLRGEGRRVFLDAEHFFDGYLADRAYAVEVLRVAAEAGAEVVALCDTNGGMLPPQVADVVADVMDASRARLGIHCHNDTGCAVANSLAAVAAGVTHVQGTINGYGERTGNADLLTVVSNLQIKQGRKVLPESRLREATRIAHAISEGPTCLRTADSRTSAQVRLRTRQVCTPVPSRSTPTCTSTPTPPPSAMTCACSSRTWQGGPASSSRGVSSATT
jgi:Isopropylmalate/homocitrate/citramalate synthases